MSYDAVIIDRRERSRRYKLRVYILRLFVDRLIMMMMMMMSHILTYQFILTSDEKSLRSSSMQMQKH